MDQLLASSEHGQLLMWEESVSYLHLAQTPNSTFGARHFLDFEATPVLRPLWMANFADAYLRLFYTTSLSHYTKPWLSVKLFTGVRISFNTYSPPHCSRYSTSSRKEVAKAMVPGFPSTHRYASRLSTTWGSKSPQNNLSIPSAQTWFGVPFLWHTFSKLTTSSMRWRTNREP